MGCCVVLGASKKVVGGTILVLESICVIEDTPVSPFCAATGRSEPNGLDSPDGEERRTGAGAVSVADSSSSINSSISSSSDSASKYAQSSTDIVDCSGFGLVTTKLVVGFGFFELSDEGSPPAASVLQNFEGKLLPETLR